MRLFLVLYFMFCALADPWVDGSGVERDLHIQVSEVQNQGSSFKTPIRVATEKSHEHNSHGCSDGCPQHTCHFGHCGTLFANKTLELASDSQNLQFGEYCSFIPDPPVYGLRRPPKT